MGVGGAHKGKKEFGYLNWASHCSGSLFKNSFPLENSFFGVLGRVGSKSGLIGDPKDALSGPPCGAPQCICLPVKRLVLLLWASLAQRLADEKIGSLALTMSMPGNQRLQGDWGVAVGAWVICGPGGRGATIGMRRCGGEGRRVETLPVFPLVSAVA